MNPELFLYNCIVAHCCKELATNDRELPPISPDWSTVAQYCGHQDTKIETTRSSQIIATTITVPATIIG